MKKKRTAKKRSVAKKKLALVLVADAQPVAEIPVPKTALRRLLDLFGT